MHVPRCAVWFRAFLLLLVVGAVTFGLSQLLPH